MTMHTTHKDHIHVHGPGCGHTAIHHGDHIDYLHEGHLHHHHEGHIDECRLEVSHEYPAACAPYTGNEHASSHIHGPDCGHEAIPHGDHMDYLVDGHLHHHHQGHCDIHGMVHFA